MCLREDQLRNRLCTVPTDIRCAFDGLSARVRNHLEHTIRPIALGRKSSLLCWTELGAKHVGVIQSLPQTCRLHDVDPYTYLVDVMQRVGQHPASRVLELTPRLWKRHFAETPLRSVIDL